MIRRPDIKENNNFLQKANEEISTIEDLHKHITPTNWPILKDIINPSLAEGSKTSSKNLTINIKEIEWNSIDRHVKALNVSKAEWIKYAIFKLMQDEQLYFLKNRKKNED